MSCRQMMGLDGGRHHDQPAAALPVVVLLPPSSSAFAEGLASPSRPVVARPPPPRSTRVALSLGWRLVDAEVDHHREPAGEASHIREERCRGREAFDVRTETSHALVGVGEQDPLGPRTSGACAHGGRAPSIGEGAGAIEVRCPSQLHPRRRLTGHVTNVRSLCLRCRARLEVTGERPAGRVGRRRVSSDWESVEAMTWWDASCGGQYEMRHRPNV